VEIHTAILSQFLIAEVGGWSNVDYHLLRLCTDKLRLRERENHHGRGRCIALSHRWGEHQHGKPLITIKECCVQQTGVRRMVGSSCLVTIYLPEVKPTSIYVRSTFLTSSPPRCFAALPPNRLRHAQLSPFSYSCVAGP
jgi:hypothetical protein